MKNIKNKKNKPVWQAPEEKQPCCPYCGSTDVNKIEVTSLTAADLQGEPRNFEQSPLGKILFVRMV